MYRKEQGVNVAGEAETQATVAVNGRRTMESAASTMLEGKGYFVWRAERVLARLGVEDPQEAARRAKAAGLKHVLVKIADGDTPFPIPSNDAGGRKEAVTAALVNALRGEGINVWGWAFVYGQEVDLRQQARVFADRARQFAIRGLVVNPEDIGERRWSSSGGAERAGQYMASLRQELAEIAGVVIGFCSYRFLRYHPSFPFDPFMEAADVAMPQVYWVARGEGDAIENLRRSYEEYKERYPRKLYIPVGAAYGENYGSGSGRYFWSATPRQIQRFMDQATALGIPAVTFWSWEHALNDPANQRYSGTELWDTIAAYDYEPAAAGGSGAPSERVGEPIEIAIEQEGYRDGLYPQFPQAAFFPFSWQGQNMKYAQTVAETPSSVWAMWRPDITESGVYEISVWIPGRNATTRRAHYHIHGVVGESGPVIVEANQNRFFDTWLSLGRYDLDADNPQSGQVNLTNATGENDRRIAFTRVSWQRVTQITTEESRLADGFDAPVGSAEERRADEVWPGNWVDANPFGNYYRLHGSYAYHTGADLNLNTPSWDSDRGKPVHAVASGEVTFALWVRNWGNIVIIRHDPLEPGGPSVYSRSAHLATMTVRRGQRVQRGQQIGTVGQDANHGPFHMHIDISPTEALFHNPGDWPGLDRGRLRRDYLDPKEFIRGRRPRA